MITFATVWSAAHRISYGFFENKLPGISMAAYAFIESARPYHSGKGVHNILRIIGRLAKIDKHRHLYVLLPRISVQDDVTYSDGMRGTSIRGGLKHGAEIPLPEEIPGESRVNMKRSFTPYVTFDETIGEGPDTVETENLLEVCWSSLKRSSSRHREVDPVGTDEAYE